MTERYDGFFVSLDRDMRDDDAEHTINAIRQIKGVIAVQPHLAHTMEGISARNRVVNEVHDKMFAFLEGLRNGK